MKNVVLTADLVREYLSYNEATGAITWIKRPYRLSAVRDGDKAGCATKAGYQVIRIGGANHLAHRIAWICFYGELPGSDIDHKNGDRADNRISNLRLATRAENCRNTKTQKNNKSGFKGVHLHKASGKWRASCKAGGKQLHLGTFNTAEDASSARQTYARLHHGEFFKE
jgi:hypothetical protein